MSTDIMLIELVIGIEAFLGINKTECYGHGTFHLPGHI